MSMAKKDRWGDLMPRLLSALVMAAIAIFGLWAGGVIFAVIIALCGGAMIWELTLMLAPRRFGLAVQLGGLGAVSVLMACLLPFWLGLLVLLLPVGLGWMQVSQDAQKRFALFSLWIVLAAYSFVWIRQELGAMWLLWMILVVVATDVAGYFAGKIFGGPKFWPRISPKKTWSGTSAGWAASIVVGIAFTFILGTGLGFVMASVLLSMASQAGDVAESALKRQTGVKDSSTLIPGHGGLFDRFDGMLGAAAMFLFLFIFLG